MAWARRHGRSQAADVITAWTSEHYANLVAINYINQETPPEPGQLRIRQHTDRGGLTLLWADRAPGGLEVMLPHSREWVPVLIPADAFLAQAGDLLARWTSCTIRPNIRRVVNPPVQVSARIQHGFGKPREVTRTTRTNGTREEAAPLCRGTARTTRGTHVKQQVRLSNVQSSHGSPDDHPLDLARALKNREDLGAPGKTHRDPRATSDETLRMGVPLPFPAPRTGSRPHKVTTRYMY